MLVSARLRSALSAESVVYIQTLPEIASPPMNNALSAFASGLLQLNGLSATAKSVDAVAVTALERHVGRRPSFDQSLVELLARYVATQEAAYAESRALFAAALQLLQEYYDRRAQVISRISS